MIEGDEERGQPRLVGAFVSGTPKRLRRRLGALGRRHEVARRTCPRSRSPIAASRRLEFSSRARPRICIPVVMAAPSPIRCPPSRACRRPCTTPGAASRSPAFTTASGRRGGRARRDRSPTAVRETTYLRRSARRAGYGEAGSSLLEAAMAAADLGVERSWAAAILGPGGKTVIPARRRQSSPAGWLPEQDPVPRSGRRSRGTCARIAPAGVPPGGHARRSRLARLRRAGRSSGPRLWRSEVLEEVYGHGAPAGADGRHGAGRRSSSARLLGPETVLFSFSTADEDYHAPNEFFRLQRLEDGLRAWLRYWQLLAARILTHNLRLDRQR